MEKGNFFLALFSATSGGLLGFMSMYMIGKWFGNTIIEKGKLSFISIEAIHKIEQWFVRYGYWLIVANRFLSGTRAVISLFAGMSNLDFVKTTSLSFLSALLWSGILVYAGYSLGQHWEDIGVYLKMYSEIITAAIFVVALIFLLKYFLKKRKSAGHG